MDPVASNSYLCDLNPYCAQNGSNSCIVRRQKISPEFTFHASSGKKPQLLKSIPALPVVPPLQGAKVNDIRILMNNDEDVRDDSSGEVKLITDALNSICDGEDVPESTPENASFDLVLDFIAAIISEGFPRALTLANEILKYEPMNVTIQEFLPVLQELIQLSQESDSSWSSESENSDSCTPSQDSESMESSDEDSEEDGDGDNCEVSDDDSISTVASDEYLSEYGEDYEQRGPENAVVPDDDGYETTTNQEEEIER